MTEFLNYSSQYYDMTHYFKMLTKFHLTRNFSLSVSKNQRKNHYDSLGVTPKATQGDIKTAYYKLSKQYHPDINSGSESAADKFRDIAEAYEVLGNVKARKLYDRGVFSSDRLRDHSQSDEPVDEKYKHAPFYHQRNKPLSTKSAIHGRSRYYDMDEWTRAHYSESFSASREKKEESRFYMEDKIRTKKENIFFAQLTAVLVLIMSIGFLYGTDASKRYDEVSVDSNIPGRKPD